MTVSIIWTNRALQRLDSIGAYIQKNNPSAAARVVGDIADSVERLAEFPHSGRPGGSRARGNSLFRACLTSWRIALR